MNILNKKAVALFVLVTAAVVSPLQANWSNIWQGFTKGIKNGKDYCIQGAGKLITFLKEKEGIKAYWNKSNTNKAKLIGGTALVVAVPVALYYVAKKAKNKNLIANGKNIGSSSN